MASTMDVSEEGRTPVRMPLSLRYKGRARLLHDPVGQSTVQRSCPLDAADKRHYETGVSSVDTILE